MKTDITYLTLVLTEYYFLSNKLLRVSSNTSMSEKYLCTSCLYTRDHEGRRLGHGAIR